MPEHQPPSGTPEYLEYGPGGPIPQPSTLPTDDLPARRSRRAWWIGGGVVALLGVGAGAWAALSFFQQGAQPAEALPATTVGYVSIDLDPAGGQKIDAFRTLNKFPAFKDEVGVNSVDDIRRKLGQSILEGLGCRDLSFDHDIDPWLGERAATAAVDLGRDKSAVVAVVQVTDESKARDAIAALNRCASDDPSDDPSVGFVVHDGWALLAQSQKIADEVSAATEDGTLADDATYQKWTKAVGDAGVVNAYLSPDAGRVLGQGLSGLFGGTYATEVTDGVVVPAGFHPTGTGETDDPFSQALSGFKGGAATLRFTGDGLELAAAGDGGSSAISALTGSTGGELVRRLPDDTAAAAGLTIPKGWVDREVNRLTGMLGSASSGDPTREFERETGLTLPDDVDTLLGSGVALSVSKNIDLEAAENTDDGTGIPVAATVKGDPDAIAAVLEKLRLKAGDLAFLGSDSSDGLVAIGPTESYRKHVLAGGDLGSDDTFTSVVPDAELASAVVYVNVDALESAFTKMMSGDDSEDLANLTPLRAIGISTWDDGGVTRFSLKITTD